MLTERVVLQWHRAAQEGGAVLVPGGVPGKGRCGTEGHAGVGLGVGLGKLRTFPSISGSVILQVLLHL